MKKKFLTLALMAVAVFTAYAEPQEAKTFSITPHLGGGYLLISNAGISTAGLNKSEFEHSVAFTGGFESEYMFSRYIGLSLGVDYTYFKSGKFKSDEYVNGIHKKDVQYVDGHLLTCPLLFNCHIPDWSGGNFSIKTGLQVGTILSAKRFEEYTTNIPTGTDVTQDLTKQWEDDFDMNKFQMWIPIGVSYTFNTPIVIDFKYNIPLKSINKESVEKNLNFTTLMLTVGYRFSLGGN